MNPYFDMNELWHLESEAEAYRDLFNDYDLTLLIDL